MHTKELKKLLLVRDLYLNPNFKNYVSFGVRFSLEYLSVIRMYSRRTRKNGCTDKHLEPENIQSI